jgi:hypothetical protein
MKKLAVVLSSLLALAVSPVAFASSGIFGSYIGVDTGGGNTWYGAQQPGSNYLTAFNGLNLGTFTIGSSVLISGGEVLTYKNGGSDVTGAALEWRVNQLTPTSSTGTFASIGIGFTTNATFNDAANNTFSSGGDQKWSSIASNPNILLGLTSGTYELEVFLRASSTDGTHFSNNGGNNFIANFTVVPVPEPATVFAGVLLVGIAGVEIFRRKKVARPAIG